MFSVAKSFQFEAAHRLIAPYEGKCNSVHGHSFEATITLKSRELNNCGMVEDFSALKPIGEWIQTNLDHATIVSSDDRSLIEWLLSHNQKLFQTSGNPTSEILAKLIFDQARALGFGVDSVRVSETCTSAASFGEE